MKNLIVCINAILPIFLIIALGFFVRLKGKISESERESFNSIAFNYFAPIMVFANIYKADLNEAFNVSLLSYCLLGAFAVWGISTIIVIRTVKQKEKCGVIIQGLYRSNFLIIGLPFSVQLLPSGTDTSSISMLLAFVIPLYNILAVISLESFNGQKESFFHLLKDIIKNPLVYGTVIGLLAAVLKLRFPSGVEHSISQLSTACSVFLLFILGCFFELGEVKTHMRELVPVVLGRLIIIPAIMLGVGYFIGFRGVEFVALISIFASSTAVASFTMAHQMGGDYALASSIVVATSALCPFTLCLWSLFFKGLGAF